jgi:ribosomal protein S18 acetylase RimI-like enzyme
MAMDLRDLAESVEGPRKLAVRRVRSDAGIEDAIAVFGGDPAIGAFYRKGAPLLLREACPMRLFVGYLDGAPVATAEVFLGSGAAGIYGVSTLERFRGQGIGSVMTWTAAGEGRREGATLAVLEASESGERVYSRLGFRACCRFWEYAPA